MKMLCEETLDVLFLSLKGTRTRWNRSNYMKMLCEETLLDETSLQNDAMFNDVEDYNTKI